MRKPYRIVDRSRPVRQALISREYCLFETEMAAPRAAKPARAGSGDMRPYGTSRRRRFGRQLAR